MGTVILSPIGIAISSLTFFLIEFLVKLLTGYSTDTYDSQKFS